MKRSKLKEIEPIRDIVMSSLGYVLIDTRLLTIEDKYETMVFKCNESGQVKDWSGLEYAQSFSEEEAREEHNKMVERWKR